MIEQMQMVRHKFRDHKIEHHTEILIIGTFNPDTLQNNADFFYSRQVKRPNELWKLLPTAILGHEHSLVGRGRAQEKKQFMADHHVDFVDVIDEISVPAGSEANYRDAFLDPYMQIAGRWRDVISEMEKLPSLKFVCFTRKGIRDIPNINKRIVEIETYCAGRNIRFGRLVSPSPLSPGKDKQSAWTEFFEGVART